MNRIFTVIGILASTTAFADLSTCTPAASHAIESYMRSNRQQPRDGWHHRLYNSYSGRNGFKQIVYTYMFNVAGGGKNFVARITLNQQCQMTTAGMWANEQEMHDDDADAASGQP